jgi:hypothetical protein
VILFWPVVATGQSQPAAPDAALPCITPGELQSVSVSIASAGKPAGKLQYTVEPASDVVVTGAPSGTLSWNPAKDRELVLKLQILVPKKQPPGPLVAARVTVRWSDERQDAIDVRVMVIALPAGTTKDLEAELIVTPRAAAPGSLVQLRYIIDSYEETDERVRLRLEAGPGWRLVDAEVTEREMLLEAKEAIEGEFYLRIPDDARIGDRQLVRLFVEVVGESGELQATNHVSVVKRGGAKPGVPLISGTSTFGLSQLGIGGVKAAQRVGALTLSSTFNRSSSFSVSFDQGLLENLSNFRYEEERTRLSGNLRRGQWDVSFGNYVNAQGNAVTGPYVRGRGASVRRLSGRLLSELVVAQPNTIGGVASGHLIRGRAGVRTPTMTFALATSDFGRPAGGYTTLSSVQTTVLDPDTEEELDFQRRLTANAASNRVRGMGVETEFKGIRGQSFGLRAGGLWLSNAAGARVSAPTGEAYYGLSTKPLTLNVRWRDTPPTVSGISIPGDEGTVDGSVHVGANVRLVCRVFQYSTETVGSDFYSHGEGASIGVRLTRGARRVEVRGNYRESQYSTSSIRRTISILASMPVGPFALTGNADVGQQETGRRLDPYAFYRGDLRWVGDAGTISVGASHSDTLGVARQRVDLMASLKFRAAELMGGAWVTRGYALGGEPGIWTSIGLPVGAESTLVLGLDYSPVTWTAESSMRATVSFQRRFSLPMPFIRARVPGAPAVSAEGETRTEP